jgi:hypothetical protein
MPRRCGANADAAGRRIYLVLDDLKTAQVPAVVYEIHLGLPADADPDDDDPHLVGTLNFFAVAPLNTASRARSFDVTALVASLASQGAAGSDLAVTIIGRSPQPAPAAAAAPTIGSVAPVAQ